MFSRLFEADGIPGQRVRRGSGNRLAGGRPLGRDRGIKRQFRLARGGIKTTRRCQVLGPRLRAREDKLNMRNLEETQLFCRRCGGVV